MALDRSKCRRVRFSLPVLLPALLMLGIATPSWAYTYRQVGVDSNFLVDEGKVYFAQSDGSLTVLALDTGTVLTRKKGWHGGTLLRAGRGILVLTFGEISLLDKVSLEPIWRTNSHCEPAVIGDRLVSYDGDGLVECRNVDSGAVVWSYRLPGALDITVKKGRVLVFRSGTYDEAKRGPAVVLLELDSGRELLHKTAPAGVHYLEAYFDGDKIYLAAGKCTTTVASGTSNYDQGRASARFEKMLVWDLGGKEVESFSVPAKLGDDGYRYENGFALAGKAFARGEVWTSLEAIPAWQLGWGKVVGENLPGDRVHDGTGRCFDLATGVVRVTPKVSGGPGSGPIGNRSTTVAVESEGKKWRGTIPYLTGQGEIVVVGGAQGRILLGSNLGHVECVDADSGRSRWMYVFPTLRYTMSYSGGGLPPYMATAAEIYLRENANRGVESGMIVDGSAERSVPAMVFDPQPANPFRYLPLYCTVAWAGAIIVPAFSGLLFWIWLKRDSDARVPAAANLLLALAAVAWLMFFGRVSVGSSVALRAGIMVPLTGAFGYSWACLGGGRSIFGLFCLLFSLGIAVLVFPAFLSL